MKMPDRPGGAGGSLVRANLFDAEDTPAFSRTRHGLNTIHKRDGDLIVTRDDEVAMDPPWLAIPYSYDAALSRPFKLLMHRVGTEAELPIDQSSAASEPQTLNFLHVGDGWLLELYQQLPARTLHLRLRNTGDLDTTHDLGLTISNFEESFPIAFDVSLCALGWRDAEHGYAFAAYYFHTGTGDYTCVTGSTAKRAIVSTASMPESPSGEGWWTPPRFVGQIEPLVDYGYGKCCTVGRGHMLALLIPREKVEHAKEDGVPQLDFVASYLTTSGAPQLLRSRDFGATWTSEPAPFLAVDGILEATDEDTGTGVSTTYDVPVRICAWASNFFACPIGDGRVAIAAGGKSDGPALEFDGDRWNANISAQTLRFFVSGDGGSGFTPYSWPLDTGRNNYPVALGAPTPSTDTILSPLYGAGIVYPRTLGTLGPGTFFVLAQRITRTVPGFVYGPYPAAYPLLAFVTRDSGATWVEEQIPAEAAPFAQTFYENKAGWSITASPIGTGDGTQVPDSWLYNWLGPCLITPCNALGEGGEVAFVTGELNGPLQLAITDGSQTFASMRRASVLERQTLWTPHPERVVGIAATVYTGDPLSEDRPEAVWLGFPEFEDRT